MTRRTFQDFAYNKMPGVNIFKAGRLLDRTPRVTSEAGFQRTVDWHVANRDH